MPLTRPAELVRLKAPEADLRRNYSRTFWSCFGISTVLLMAFVVLFPDLDADAYSKSEKVIIQIEDIPETRQERRPPPPPRSAGPRKAGWAAKAAAKGSPSISRRSSADFRFERSLTPLCGAPFGPIDGVALDDVEFVVGSQPVEKYH